MEVLKVGRKNVCTCSKCGSELRVSDGDVRVDHRPLHGAYDDPDPEDHYRTYVCCPVCHSQVPYTCDWALKCKLVARAREVDDGL